MFEDDDESDGSTGVGASTRVTASPINSDTRLLHLGGSYFYRSSLKSSWSPRLGIRKGDKMKFNYDASEYRDGLGLELVGKYGPLWLQSEYFKASTEPELPHAARAAAATSRAREGTNVRRIPRTVSGRKSMVTSREGSGALGRMRDRGAVCGS